MPFLPPKKGQLFLVPNGIRPVMQRTGIEVCNSRVRVMVSNATFIEVCNSRVRVMVSNATFIEVCIDITCPKL